MTTPQPGETSAQRATYLPLDAVNFTKGNGLVTVVAQHAHTGVVLMVAHADREALEYTGRTGEMHYHSRRRGLWHKGATSGNVQRVVSLTLDCDGDAILARVLPTGPACHEGTTSCFREGALHADIFGVLDHTIVARQTAKESYDPQSYTQTLLANRNLRLKKLGEEAVELATACIEEDRERATEEAADLIYHALVALRAVGGSVDGVRAVLAARAK